MQKFFGLDYDKWLHLFAGYIITITILLFNTSLFIALIIAVTIALAKELYDDYAGRYFDWYDFIWTIVGAFFAAVIFYLVKS